MLVRRTADADAWEAQGAGARLVSLDDRPTLTEALTGCAGFFALLPFDLTVDALDDHAERLIESIAGAVADAGVPHDVLLSSGGADLADRKSTRLNSSHVAISYAVFCLKRKNT